MPKRRQDNLPWAKAKPCPKAGCGKTARPVWWAGSGNGAPEPPRQISTLHPGNRPPGATRPEGAPDRTSWPGGSGTQL